MPTVAEHIITYLKSAGVRRVWGIAGDSVNAFTDAVRRDGDVEWMHVRHEEAAAFAASGEGQASGELVAVAGSCGPGTLHLINGLYDAHRSRVPVLAIATQIPQTELGTGYFQETHDTRLFRECTHWCEALSSPAQLPRMIELAVRAAVLQRGAAMIVVPGDVAVMEAPEPRVYVPAFVGRLVPPAAAIDALATMIEGSKRTTIMAGIGCAGAEEDVLALADRLRAPIVHAFRGKHLFDANPHDMGLTGLVGEKPGYEAVMGADALLLLGTDFPYDNFLPDGDMPVAQVDVHGPALGRRTRVTVPVQADVGETVRALLPRIATGRSSDWLDESLQRRKKGDEDGRAFAQGHGERRPIHPEYLTARINAIAAPDAAFTVDTGANNIWAGRFIDASGGRTIIGSLRHGSMANALPQAMGIAAADRDRQVVALCGDGGIAMLLGELLTLRQLDLPVKAVVYNNGSLGFVALEMKAAGFVNFGVDLLNPDFSDVARAAGLHGIRVEEPARLDSALEEAFAHPGPVVIDVVTAHEELPNLSHVTADDAKGFSLYALRSMMAGRGGELLEVARDYFGKR